jgi:hypothetical protein
MQNAVAALYLPLNRETIQIINIITTTTAIMPTTAPALKIPPITAQPLKLNNSNNAERIYNFFICMFLWYNKKTGQLVLRRGTFLIKKMGKKQA